MKVAVLGAGAWGTALAGHLATRHDTVLWARDRALIESCRHAENERYLRGVAARWRFGTKPISTRR
jgi:glycerol-3-phosphate dehydrogenase (NAD(P)+)